MGSGSTVRILVCVAALCTSTPSLADPCGNLAARVSSATGIEVGEREHDFVSYLAGPDTMVTLACGTRAPSSVGAQHRGEEPPDSYFRLFGQAGQVVTGIAADRIVAAAQRAWANAPRLNHSNVATDGALVTCTFTRSRAGDAMTMCAVIAQSDQS